MRAPMIYATGVLIAVLIVCLGVLLWGILVVASRAERDAERRELEAKERRCSVTDLDKLGGKPQ
jgi:hypothetical protein